MALVVDHLDDGVLTVVLNRPEKKNAVDQALLEALEDTLLRRCSDPAVRTLILHGSGNCFCAGADIGALHSFNPQQMRAFHDLRERVFCRLEKFPRPTLAVIEGFALGTGLELALSTDFRLAAADAQLGIPSSRLGVVESYPYTARLVRCAGLARTQFLLLSGERLSAEEARVFGLVERVVPAATLAERVAALAKTLASNAPRAMAQAKQIARHCWRDPLLKRVDDPAQPFVASAGREELHEGTTAFLDKRSATFPTEHPD